MMIFEFCPDRPSHVDTSSSHQPTRFDYHKSKIKVDLVAMVWDLSVYFCPPIIRYPHHSPWPFRVISKTCVYLFS